MPARPPVQRPRRSPSSSTPKTTGPAYGRDEGGQRYSPLTQIDAKNVSKLKLAWQYAIDPKVAQLGGPQRMLSPTEAVPIVIGNVLFTPTTQHTVVALEADTGQEIWKYDLGKASGTMRGVSFWPGDSQSPAQIFSGTTDGKLIALNAETGKPVPGFGNEGDCRPARRRHRKIPQDAVSHELARRDLWKPDHHRSAGPGR